MRVAIFSAIRGSILDVSRRQNAIFWVSQLAVVFSTIVGVYLASSEGLKSAIEFHVATKTEKKFYTLSALHAEVESNNNLIMAFNEKNHVRDDTGTITAHRSMRLPDLNWFVWVTMMQSSESLDLPVGVLKDVNTYYTQLSELSERYQNSGGRDKLFQAKKIDTLTQETQADLLTRMKSQIDVYAQSMKGFKGLGHQQ